MVTKTIGRKILLRTQAKLRIKKVLGLSLEGLFSKQGYRSQSSPEKQAIQTHKLGREA
jgi:hypothetical protein